MLSFRPKIKNKIIAVLFAILPVFVVGSLVFGANVYYDLDVPKVIVNEVQRISKTGQVALEVLGITRLGDGGATNYAEFSETGDLTFTGTADTIIGPGAGGLTFTNDGGSLTVSTTSSGTLTLTSAGVLDLNSLGGTWDATTLSLDATDNSNLKVTGSGKTLTVEAAGGGANQVIVNSAGTSAGAIDINATEIVAGNAITIDTTDGGISLAAGGADNGDISFIIGDNFSLTGAAGSVFGIATGNVAQQIDIGTGTDIDTINIGTGATGADVIRIGQAAADLALTDAQWSVTGLGAAAFDSLTVGGGYGSTGVTVTNVGAISADSDITTKGKLGIIESVAGGSTNFTYFQGGSQAIDLTYTLPDAYAGINGYVLSSTTVGVLSWAAAGSVVTVGSMTGTSVFYDSTATGDWLGLGASAGRIAFDDQATDFVNILSANLGVGTTGPDAKIDALATSGEQLRLTYADGTAYTGFTVDINGDLEINSSGGDVNIAANDNLTLTSGTGSLAITGYSGTGNAASITSSSTTDLNKALNISQTGATTGTDYGLYVANTGAGTTNVGGYFTASGATNNYGLIVASGNVGIGTITPVANFQVAQGTTGIGTVSNSAGGTTVTGVGTQFLNTFKTGDTITINGETVAIHDIASNTSMATAAITGANSNVVYTLVGGARFSVLGSGNIGIGTTTPSSLLTISSTGDFAIGDYNAVLIDDMEVITDWTALDGANTPVALESANVRKGSGAMKITTSATAASSLNDTIKKTFGANQNYSTYERIGFWIKATQAGQNISFAFNDTVAGTSTHAVTVAEANQWQYEEYNISGITDTSRDVIDWAQFLINTYTDSSNPTFYIDQVRVYDSDERTSEMFVDNDGNLVVWGRGGIELGRGVPGSSLAGLKIGSANVEINQPLNVNVAGDTGMSYDLQFLNTGGANITSLGALTISAGDPNKTQNLTLTTQANQMSGDSGISTGSSAITLIDTNKAWTASEWVGGTVTIIGGPGAGQTQDITANTTTTVTVADWTGTALDTTVANSIYHLAYAKGGDTVIDIQNSDIVYGGFKIAGVDEGGYVFRVSPDGNVEIGGNGSAGSNLVVKQNFSLTGGNITISKLSIASAGTPSLSENADQTGSANSGCSDATAYYYKVTALNDNGETTGSTEATITTGAASGTYVNDDTITITWTAVSGAAKYKIHRSADQTWDAGANDYWVDKKYITSPTISHTDNCQTGDDTASDAPPATNTTGGKIAINTSSPAINLEVLENTSATAQMKLISDSSNYSEFYVDSTGDLSIDVTGSGGDDIRILDQNLRVCAGGSIGSDSCPTVALSAKGNLVVENKIYTNGDNENMPRHSCPTGWVLVPGSTAFGTEDFCVMKYEAKKNSSTKNPESVAAGTPWVSVSQYEAKSACTRVGAHLINEAEWMTIARNIEATTINDLDSAANLQLGNGNSTSAAAYAAVTDPVISSCNLTLNLADAANAWSSTCQLRGTNGDTADFGYTSDGASNFSIAYDPATDSKAHIRTHVLSNGNVIWDIAGNVWEWTDAQCETVSWHNGLVWEEWNDVDLTDYEQIVGGSTAYIGANGVGKYYGCTINGNAFLRGGYWLDGANAGAFALDLSDAPSNSNTIIGFRCSR